MGAATILATVSLLDPKTIDYWYQKDRKNQLFLVVTISSLSEYDILPKSVSPLSPQLRWTQHFRAARLGVMFWGAQK